MRGQALQGGRQRAVEVLVAGPEGRLLRVGGGGGGVLVVLVGVFRGAVAELQALVEQVGDDDAPGKGGRLDAFVPEGLVDGDGRLVYAQLESLVRSRQACFDLYGAVSAARAFAQHIKEASSTPRLTRRQSIKMNQSVVLLS